MAALHPESPAGPLEWSRIREGIAIIGKLGITAVSVSSEFRRALVRGTCASHSLVLMTRSSGTSGGKEQRDGPQ
jgi:hypothetical protein